MRQRSREAGLTRLEHTTRTRGEGQEKTWAESQEEGRRHEEVSPGEYETHSLGNETVHEEEHKCVEEDGRLAGLTVHKLHVRAWGGQKNTWAEREKKGGGDGDLLGSDVGEHLIYIYIIFHEFSEMEKSSSTHHLFV